MRETHRGGALAETHLCNVQGCWTHERVDMEFGPEHCKTCQRSSPTDDHGAIKGEQEGPPPPGVSPHFFSLRPLPLASPGAHAPPTYLLCNESFLVVVLFQPGFLASFVSELDQRSDTKSRQGFIEGPAAAGL